MRDKIIEVLSRITGVEAINLEVPENQVFGDYSTNVAMQQSAQSSVRRSPKNIADEYVGKLKTDKDLSEIVDQINVAGPGFINFFLKKDVLIDILLGISSQKFIDRYSDIGKDKTVIIDYSSPNIAKPFGIGHLRSTLIGQALYNIYKSLGYKVIGDNHLGDWGTQFGKLIYMIKTEAVDKLNIEKLEELYIKFHKLTEDPEKTGEMEKSARGWFKKLEDGDPEARSIWQKCIDISKQEFESIYKLLEVKIDHSYGESFYEEQVKELAEDNKIKRELVAMGGESKGWVIDLSDFNIKVPLMFLKSDGATTYATRDLATIKFRVEQWNPDIIIYEVGSEQGLHFEQVFAAARKIGLVRPEVVLYHTRHGLYLAPDGKKFSTRKGKTIKLKEVLDEAVERAVKLGSGDKTLARDVGIGAIKYFDLMHSVQSDVVFDWDKILNMEGNSGPYLQYTFARTQSVIRKAGMKNNKSQMPTVNENLTLNEEELVILRVLVHFPELVIEAAEKFAPNLICNYLYNLAQKYNTFYARHKILGINDKNVELVRLEITKATGIILKEGLNLLGIKAPEKM